MVYILIGALTYFDAVPVNAEFNSQGACLMAKAAIQKEFSANLVCVPKG